MGDNVADKPEFKIECQPAPDNVTTRFFVGQRRVQTGTLHVYIGGVEVSPSAVDYARGEMTLAPAPSGGIPIQATYDYRWFDDTDLQEFVTMGAALVGYEVTADALSLQLRPAVLDFACYYAYMTKAAEFAEGVSASVGGYTMDQTKSHPNWRALAEQAFQAGKDKVELYRQAPAATIPTIRFTTAYRLPPYTPST